MIVDLLKIWPSAILITFIAGFWYNWLWIHCFLWIIIGIVSFALNGKDHVKESLISNLVFLIIAAILIVFAWFFDF